MPSGKSLEMTLIFVPEGYSAMFTPTEEGKHKVDVTYADLPLPKSPYTVMVEIAIDVMRVRVRGLETRKLNKNSQNPVCWLKLTSCERMFPTFVVPSCLSLAFSPIKAPYMKLSDCVLSGFEFCHCVNTSSLIYFIPGI